MKNNLIPVKRTDINGKTTTRWVKAGADDKPAPRGIPAPKSTGSKERALRCRMTLFPQTQTYDDTPDKEYAVTIHGHSTFYSPAEAQQLIERLPARTLTILEETLDKLPEGKARELVAQSVYDMIREMDQMGGTAAAPLIMKEQARNISNSCVFSEMTAVMDRVKPHTSVSDHMFMIDVSVQTFENDGQMRSNPRRSEIDYSAKSKKEREAAQDYVMADQLYREFGSSYMSLPSTHAELVSEYRGQWDRLADVIKERGFNDAESVRMVVESEVPAMSEGAL